MAVRLLLLAGGLFGCVGDRRTERGTDAGDGALGLARRLDPALRHSGTAFFAHKALVEGGFHGVVDGNEVIAAAPLGHGWRACPPGLATIGALHPAPARAQSLAGQLVTRGAVWALDDKIGGPRSDHGATLAGAQLILLKLAHLKG